MVSSLRFSSTVFNIVTVWPPWSLVYDKIVYKLFSNLCRNILQFYTAVFASKRDLFPPMLIDFVVKSMLSLETTELTEKTHGDFKFFEFTDSILVQTALPPKTNVKSRNHTFFFCLGAQGNQLSWSNTPWAKLYLQCVLFWGNAFWLNLIYVGSLITIDRSLAFVWSCDSQRANGKSNSSGYKKIDSRILKKANKDPDLC